MKTVADFYVIAHNIRSLYNVGTIFRTADALGVKRLFLTGYSPYPPRQEISKVALGSEQSVAWQHCRQIGPLLKKLKKQKIQIIALETGPQSVDYRRCQVSFPLALVIGNEVRGLSAAVLSKADAVISLPMRGLKESLNVGVALGAVGYYLDSQRKMD